MESYTNRLFTPFPFVSLLLGDAKGINQPTIHYTAKLQFTDIGQYYRKQLTAPNETSCDKEVGEWNT